MNCLEFSKKMKVTSNLPTCLIRMGSSEYRPVNPDEFP